MPHAPAACSPEAAHRCFYLPLAKSRTPHAHTPLLLAVRQKPHAARAHRCSRAAPWMPRRSPRWRWRPRRTRRRSPRKWRWRWRPPASVQLYKLPESQKKYGQRVQTLDLKPWAVEYYIGFSLHASRSCWLLARSRTPLLLLAARQKPHAARAHRCSRAAPWMPRRSPRWRWRPRRTRRRSPWKWRWRPLASVQPCKLPESQKKITANEFKHSTSSLGS